MQDLLEGIVVMMEDSYEGYGELKQLNDKSGGGGDKKAADRKSKWW